MMKKRESAFVLYLLCGIVFLLSGISTKETVPTTGTDVKQFAKDLFNDIQLLRVEGFAEKEPHLRREWTRIIDEIRRLPEIVQSLVKRIGNEAKQAFVERFSKNEKEFENQWEYTAKTIAHALTTARDDLKTITKGTQQRITRFEETHLKDAKDNVKQHWDSVKKKLQDQLTKVEQSLHLDLTKSKERWDQFFHKMEHHVKHSPHHPVLRCSHCGRPYTLHEFLQLFDREGAYLIQIEDWWSDQEVEEFFEGWAEWANRYAIHCVDCGSTRWDNVEFVSEEQEKTIEKEHHVIPEVISKHDELI